MYILYVYLCINFNARLIEQELENIVVAQCSGHHEWSVVLSIPTVDINASIHKQLGTFQRFTIEPMKV